VRIATYNVNGVNGRLAGLLAWLAETQPDVVCLQELKAPEEKFPDGPLWRAGYGSIWHGESRWNGVAILAKGCEPVQTRRGLPGDKADVQSRYLEAAVNGVIVASLYAPNGNPQPGPKFEFKLRWLERLHAHAAGLLTSGHPVVLAGDFNIIPEPRDVYAPERWLDDALFHPKVREAYARLLAQGWTDALRARFPTETVYTFWKYWRGALERDAGLRIDHLLLSPDLAPRLTDAGVDRAFRARAGASDHAAVWIEIADDKKRRRRAG
jgi:exodeoxyribonuclease III